MHALPKTMDYKTLTNDILTSTCFAMKWNGYPSMLSLFATFDELLWLQT